MPLERDLWLGRYSRDAFPPFLCPHCRRGRLNADDKSLVTEEPRWSKEARNHEAWDPEWIGERFVLLLRCSVAKCGEVVAVSGEVTWHEVIDDERGWAYEAALRPVSMFPPPPIISVPDETPDDVKEEIGLAFQMIWSDLGASASRLRTSVELLLDDFKIPREGKGRKKTYRLSLQERINAFKAVDTDYATTFDALRIVGNLGTHENELRRNVLLDSFEIYEDALSELYGKHKKKIEALRKKIIGKRGKY